MIAAALAALALAAPPVSGHAWRSVFRDWLDDRRFEQPHTCASVLVARAHVETMSYPAGYARLPTDLGREARRACGRGDPARVRLGMTDTEVGLVAGLPRLRLSGLRCWAYTTRRVCFAAGRVTRVQLVTHGG